MVTSLSSRYKSGLGRRPKKKAGQRLRLGSLFWKLTSLIVVAATLLGIAGSLWFSWSIRRGLDALTAVRAEKHALQQVNANLQSEQKSLLDPKHLEQMAAAKLGLFPTAAQEIGGGVSVRVPEP